MKSLLWFLLGIAGGFVLAHLVNKDPRGHEILADVDARITEFTDRMETGETIFSATYNEHLKYVQQMQQWCSEHPDSGC